MILSKILSSYFSSLKHHLTLFTLALYLSMSIDKATDISVWSRGSAIAFLLDLRSGIPK
jgi:hypothetical protein